MANLEELANTVMNDGYSEMNAEAKVCQDIVLKAIAQSSLNHNVTIKGGVVIKQFPNAKVYLNGDTQLPTHEDHNYDLYLKCFRRVIAKHIDSIPIYKENHPGYKVIFLVFDESSAYFEAEQAIDHKKQLHKGEGMSGRPHFFFVDDDFLSVFADNGIDYLFWYTPYKLFEHITPPLELPTLCVYDLSVKPFPHQTYKYDNCRMSSVEI